MSFTESNYENAIIELLRDRKRFGDPDISKDALPKFIEKLEVCRDLFMVSVTINLWTAATLTGQWQLPAASILLSATRTTASCL